MFDFSIVTKLDTPDINLRHAGGIWRCILRMCRYRAYALWPCTQYLPLSLFTWSARYAAFFRVPPGSEAVGKWGLLQVPCDVLKMLTKEIIEPEVSDKFLYNLAPFMVIISPNFSPFRACLSVKGWKCWTST